MWSLGALGEQGPLHAMDLLIEETKAALGQIGARSVHEARTVEIRHLGAYTFAPHKG
jgi:L-lactate dehydrogenase (cytochrome)